MGFHNAIVNLLLSNLFLAAMVLVQHGAVNSTQYLAVPCYAMCGSMPRCCGVLCSVPRRCGKLFWRCFWHCFWLLVLLLALLPALLLAVMRSTLLDFARISSDAPKAGERER